MRTLLGGLRFLGLWVLPFIVTVVLLLMGFAYWCVSTSAGTRWLLETAAEQFDGAAQGVHGTIRDGVFVEGLSLVLPGAHVRIVGLHLKTLWSELLERRLHINDLSAVRADVDLQLEPSPQSDDQPFQMPALPLDLRVDHLSLDGLGLAINGEQPPVELLAVSTVITLDRHAARVRLDRLQATWDRMLLSLNGSLAASPLAAPWPLTLDLQGYAQDRRADSPLCVRNYLGRQAADQADEANQAGQGAAPAGAAVASAESGCRIDVSLRAAGSLEALALDLHAQGQGMTLAAAGNVFPQQAFPLGHTQLDLALPKGVKAALTIDPAPADPAMPGSQRLTAQFSTQGLALNPWLPQELGKSVLTLKGEAGFELDAARALDALSLNLIVGPDSWWNGQTLAGTIAVDRVGVHAGSLVGGKPGNDFDPFQLRVSGLNTDIALGGNRVQASGNIDARGTALAVQATTPALSAVWPGLPGGAHLQLSLKGSLEHQTLSLDAGYTPEDSEADVVGRAPIAIQLALEGAWAQGAGWGGTVRTLEASHAGLHLHSEVPVPLAWRPAAKPAAAANAEAASQNPADPIIPAPPWGWQVGAARLAVALDDEPLFRLDHESSSGSGRRWASRARVDALIVTPQRIEHIRQWLARGETTEGGVNTPASRLAKGSELVSDLSWALSFDDALSGEIHLQRTGGDLVVPGDVPIELKLRAASLDVLIRRTAPGLSQVQADLQVSTSDMGSMRVRAETPLHATAGGGVGLREQDTKTVHLEAESEDLAWVNLFLPGGVEVGGTIHADIKGRSQPDGRWNLNGPLAGENLDIVNLDQGIRLLDGTLKAHFDGQRVTLDALRFPAVRRVTPKEWRTATWISEEPEAQNGSLSLSGRWDLFNPAGGVAIVLDHYPILQRSDRYAIVSGTLQIDSVLPEIDIRGKVVADAGWFDLDMLNNIPSLDGDVIVLQPGQNPVIEVPENPLDIDLDVTVDLGPRFYITGYGVNSGLTGDLNLRMVGDKLTAIGLLRTRGGSLDAYGQHLQLRRGTITFQGDISNPVIGIEALRTDAAVHAGVRVAGTARRPRIDLVSYPDVSETEKLTWLLLGRGPDEGGGGDMALLVSVGSSFLSDGEPFYQRFGLDELTMRSGELGSSGSILPVDSVVSSQNTGSASDIEKRFISAGKTLSKDLRVSLEQALSQTGTVARLSYRLMRGLRAEVTAGTVNGLALVYRWFSMD